MKAAIIIEISLTLFTIISVKHHETAEEKQDYLRERYLQSTKTHKATRLMKMASWSQGPVCSDMETWKEIKKMWDEFIKMNRSDVINMQETCILQYIRGL